MNPHLIESLNTIGDTCLADSRRWFPELHTRSRAALAAHYTLGLVGELGEVEEVLYVLRDLSALPGELADVFIYGLDLGRCLDIDVTTAVSHAWQETDIIPVLVTVGALVNAIKKLNRTNPYSGSGAMAAARDACVATITAPLGRLLHRNNVIAAANGIDIYDAFITKHDVLEERWG